MFSLFRFMSVSFFWFGDKLISDLLVLDHRGAETLEVDPIFFREFLLDRVHLILDPSHYSKTHAPSFIVSRFLLVGESGDEGDVLREIELNVRGEGGDDLVCLVHVGVFL